MFLSDRQLKVLIAKGLVSDTASVQPASLDLHLGNKMQLWNSMYQIDPEKDQSRLWNSMVQGKGGRWNLPSFTLAHAKTVERISVPKDYVAMIHGLSSLGRLGLMIHITAGLIDPGNSLIPTLELVSLGGDILLRPGMRIAQVTFHLMVSECDTPYQGKYQGDEDLTASRMFMEYQRESDPEARPADITIRRGFRQSKDIEASNQDYVRTDYPGAIPHNDPES